MAVQIKHAFVSLKGDGSDLTQVQPSNWNANHVLTQATGKVLGRVTAGAGSLRTDRPRPQPRLGSGDTVEPYNNIRRRTAEHMLASVATSAHAVTAVEVDYEAVERVRALRGEAWAEREGFGLTYLPFISRAVTLALRDFPHINASVGDGELVVHNYVISPSPWT